MEKIYKKQYRMKVVWIKYSVLYIFNGVELDKIIILNDPPPTTATTTSMHTSIVSIVESMWNSSKTFLQSGQDYNFKINTWVTAHYL